MEWIPLESLQDAILANLSYCGTDQELVDVYAMEAVAWYRHLLGQGHGNLTFFLALDVGVLLREGHAMRFASLRDFSTWPEEERSLRLRYENEFLSRLLHEPRMQEALEILHHAPASEKNGLHLRLMELLWRALGRYIPQDVMIAPPHLRGYSLNATAWAQREGARERLAAALSKPPAFAAQLAGFLETLSREMRWSSLLCEEDIFELSHWRVLDQEALRIGCRQLGEMARRLGEVDLRELPLPDEDAQDETAFVDETYYPTGGISELTTRGAFENLVLSELIYIEPEEHIDLFDVRFVEGELLFYTRDAGQLRRKRRSIHLILDLDQVFSFKSSGYEYQFSILSLGFCVRLIRDLSVYFEQDALQFHLHCLHGSLPEDAFAADLALARLLLDDAIQHGWLHLHLAPSLSLASCLDPQRKVYAIILAHARASFWREELSLAAELSPPIQGILLPITETAFGASSRRDQFFGVEKQQEKQKDEKVSEKKRRGRKSATKSLKKPAAPDNEGKATAFSSLELPLSGLSMEALASLRTQLLIELVGG